MKAIASDLDGTLVFHQQIKDSDIKAIANFQSHGYLFGICTGRPLVAIEDLDSRLHPDFYIVSSGALILDKYKNILYQKAMNYDDVKKIYQRYVNHTRILFQTSADVFYGTVKDNELIQVIQSIDEISDLLFYGISIVVDSDEEASKISKDINRDFDVNAFQNTNSIDIVASGVSKGEGIQFIKKHYHLDTMMAIGDSYNDVSMLNQADYSFTFYSSPLDMITDYRVSSVNEAINIIMEEEAL